MESTASPNTRSLLALSWPTIATFSGLAIRAVCDVWLAGNLGKHELAALAPAQLILLLILSFGYGALYLVNSFASQAIGSETPRDAGRYAWQGIWISVIYGLFALLAWIAAPFLFRFFGHDPLVAVEEVRYLKVACFSIGWQMIAFAATNFFFALSRPLVPMVVTLVAVTVHCLVGYGLTLGLGESRPLGMTGIGLALVASSAVQALALVAWMAFDRQGVAHGSRLLAFSRRKVGDLLRTGLPLGARDLLDNVVWGIVVIWLIGSFGPVPMAAATVILVVNDTLMLPCDGIGSGMVTLMGRSLGRRDTERAEAWRRIGMRTVMTFTLLAGGLVFVFREPFFNLLVATPEVAALCIDLAGFVPVLLVLYAYYGIYDHALTAAGDNLAPTIMNLVLTTLILGLGGWLFLRFFPHTESYGVWTLMAVNLLVITASFLLRWRSGQWRTLSLVDSPDPPVAASPPPSAESATSSS